MQKRYLLFIVVITFLLSGSLFAGTYSGGSGTSGDPYKIATTEDLIELSNTSGDWSWGNYFIQTANISFDEDETQVDWNNDGSPDGSGTSGFEPIGNSSQPASCSYDGQNHTIKNIYINRPNTDYVGLFGWKVSDSVINLGLVNADITGQNNVGAITGKYMCGYEMMNCFSTGTINGAENVGGLVGINDNTDIGYSYIGKSYSMCNVSGTNNVGGFIGYNYNGGDYVDIIDCWSSGDVTRSSGTNTSFGAFCGNNYDGGIHDSYATGSVFQSDGATALGTDNGFVGTDNSGYYGNNFFDTDVSNQSTGTGATGKTTAQMQTESTFTNAGWDFTNTWAMSSEISFDEYPTLQWTGAYAEAPSGSPYQITSLPNLVWIAEDNSRWSNDYEQTADINAWTTTSWDDGKGWTPIGKLSPKFTGSYDGQGHTLDYLYINRPSTMRIGLFGYVNGAIITNMVCTHVDITGQLYVGGIAGMVVGNTTISNSYTTGSVSGNNYIGGLGGYLNNDCQISKCYSICSVSGNDYVGGLVAYNSTSYINDCYSRGSVSGNQYVGGLVGLSAGTSSRINNCYSTGSVTGNWVGGLVGWKTGGLVNYSYWDTETSGQSSSIGGTGKTTAEMHTRSTYAGWDFESIWSMSPGYNDGYPNHDNEASYTDITWQGDVDDQWGTAGNWDLGVVPNSTHNVFITTDGQAPVIPQNYGQEGYGAECHNLTVETGATLSIPHPNTPPEVGALITYGTITNNGTIEIGFNTPQEDEHLVSSPVTSITAEVFEGDYLQSWDEPTEEWVEIIDETTPLTPAKGYSLWPTFRNSTQYTFTGTPNTGDQSITITYNNNSSEQDGFNLVGNPYPSPINWDLLQPTYGAAYIWVPANGDYTEWNESSGGEQNIATLQSFFVYTDGSNTSLDLKNKHRTFGNTTHYRSASTLNKTKNRLLLEASNGSYADQFTLRFDEHAAPGFELTNDAWKLLSDNCNVCQIWSQSPDGKLAVDVRPYESFIQLGFQNNQPGVYSIGIKEIADIPEVYLEDTKTGTFHDLTQSAYEFAWKITDSESRFNLCLRFEENINDEISDNITYLNVKDQPDEIDITTMVITGRAMLQKPNSVLGIIQNQKGE